VTIGLPSADLARDVNEYLVEIAHEFFHTWNLMALRPAGWGTLSYKPPVPTTGLWWSEGVTMYYAYLLPRRIGFPGDGHTRIEQLEEDLGEYFSNPGNIMVSPERASLLVDAGPEERGDFPGDYYLTGRLIGEALELIVSAVTHNKHGLDEVMRAMYERHPLPNGFAPKDVEYAVSAVCRCDEKTFFDDHVRGSQPLDFNRYLSTIGLQMALDTIPVADSAGVPFPDTRVWVNPSKRDGTMQLMLYNPNSVWAKARLHTGEQLLSFNGIKIDSMPDMRRAVRAIKLNDVVPVDVVRGGVTQRINVTVTGYTKVRAKIIDRPDITRAQMAMRDHWLAGRLAEDEFVSAPRRRVVLDRQQHKTVPGKR
jgi:predicted metalloprotease with PDZ domain